MIPDKIITAYQKARNGDLLKTQIPPLWDGKAAERIVDIIKNKLQPCNGYKSVDKKYTLKKDTFATLTT